MAERNTNYLLRRDEVLERYGGKCANCGSSDDLEIHHIVPVALGGTDNVTNLIPLCHVCHLSAHRGRSIDDIKEHLGTAKRGGRKSKIDFDEFDKAFEKYATGRIGKKKFCELVGYSDNVLKKCPHYAKSMSDRGIVRLKNNVDVMFTNSGNIGHGAIVGVAEYDNGRTELMFWDDTGENDVEYTQRKLNGTTYGERRVMFMLKREREMYENWKANK